MLNKAHAHRAAAAMQPLRVRNAKANKSNIAVLL
jgi:hypothetical protein